MSERAAIQVKEKPILFSGPMVKAILDGRKTMTRRVLDRMTGFRCRHFGPSDTHGYDWHFRCERGLWQDMRHDEVISRCPFGSVGDRLWCKETFRLPICFDEDSPSKFGEKCIEAGYQFPWCPMKYDADGEEWLLPELKDGFGGEWGKTRVSIHMPRWASRITLEITDIRVGRLQDISEEDAIAEGYDIENEIDEDPIPWFCWLWKRINGPDSWAANPWVWAISFKRVAQ